VVYCEKYRLSDGIELLEKAMIEILYIGKDELEEG
jgi:dCMP deaminase